MKSKVGHLYVNLTFACNQRCVFCVSDETVANRGCTRSQFLSPTVFAQELSRLPGSIDTIHFSGGEPTLHPALEQILTISANRFKHMQLATNGISFANKAKLERVLEIARMQIIVPFFTFDREIHRRLVGVDSLDAVVRGLRNISECAANGNCLLSLKLIPMAQTMSRQCELIDMLSSQGIIPTEFIVSGLCRTDGALRNECVIAYDASPTGFSALARKVLAQDKPYCFHRIPLCAFEPDIWPYLMTIDKKSRTMEHATAHVLYPDGTVSDIPPHHVEERVCQRCDLSTWCEYASNRNAEQFDYSCEFTPIDLEQTIYRQKE